MFMMIVLSGMDAKGNFGQGPTAKFLYWRSTKTPTTDLRALFAVFQIFDDDGDGLLSYQEFVAMMKDRIHRGLKSYSR